MLLSKVQNYFKTHAQVSLGELSQALDTDSAVLREMLQLLVRKGRIRRIEGKSCGGCHSCAPEALEFYQRVDPEQ